MLVGIVIVATTRIMSLAVVLGLTVSGASQGLLVAFGGEPDAYYGFAVGAWLMVLFAHRDNLRRLASGTERVLGRPKSAAGDRAAVVESGRQGDS
jgi:glycerol-3-phosphate acyltransferase PlsY